MRIIIDADACPRPVKDICITEGNKRNIEVIMVVDDAHELKGDFTVISVSQGDDSVDHKIITMIEKDDILITQDYGLASIVLQRCRGVLHPKGMKYTIFNIDALLMQRHEGQKLRKSGGRTKGPKKRTKEDDISFEKSLLILL